MKVPCFPFEDEQRIWSLITGAGIGPDVGIGHVYIEKLVLGNYLDDKFSVMIKIPWKWFLYSLF